MSFEVKDSGVRASYASGMVRDTQEGKTEFHRVFDGPMLERWAEHLTKGAAKYPDDPTPNWMRADSEDELKRFRASAVRHFVQWLRGDRDEDHAAAVFFNINAAEYVRDRIADEVGAAQVGLDGGEPPDITPHYHLRHVQPIDGYAVVHSRQSHRLNHKHGTLRDFGHGSSHDLPSDKVIWGSW